MLDSFTIYFKRIRSNCERKLSHFFLLPIIFFLITSCSGVLIKIAYNNADWFIKNEVDKLLDITWSQDSLLSRGLRVFMAEHRENELPQVGRFMDNLKQKMMKEEITQADIDQVTNDFAVLRGRWVDSLLNEKFTEFVNTIEMDQVNTLEESLKRFTEPHPDKNKQTFRDRSDAENQAYYFERRKKNIITWFGEITPYQEKLFREFPLFDRSYWEMYYLERKKIVDRVLRQFRQLADNEAADKKNEIDKTIGLIRGLMKDPNSQYGSEYQTVQRKRMAQIYPLIITLHKSLTPRQKKHVEKEINYYRGVVTDLMRLAKAD